MRHRVPFVALIVRGIIRIINLGVGARPIYDGRICLTNGHGLFICGYLSLSVIPEALHSNAANTFDDTWKAATAN